MSAINQMLRDLDKRGALDRNTARDTVPMAREPAASGSQAMAGAYAAVRLLGPRTRLSRNVVLAAGVLALLPIAWAASRLERPPTEWPRLSSPLPARTSAVITPPVPEDQTVVWPAPRPAGRPAATPTPSVDMPMRPSTDTATAPSTTTGHASPVATAADTPTSTVEGRSPSAVPNAEAQAPVARPTASPLPRTTPPPSPTTALPLPSTTAPPAPSATSPAPAAARPPGSRAVAPVDPAASPDVAAAPAPTPVPASAPTAVRDTRLAMASPTVPRDDARIERRPTDARDDLTRAGEAMAIGRNSEAIVLLRKVIQTEPDNERARLALLSLLDERGRDEVWRAALADSARALPRRFGLAAAQGLAESGRFDESLVILRFLPETLRDSRYYSALGATHQQLQQHADAVAAFDAALATAPATSVQVPSLLVAQAFSMQSLGKVDDARRNLERVRHMPEAAADVRDYANRELAHPR